ncbi:MAG: G1 family glutamic endopeptidase [Minisyncoccia bacterium]
MRDARYWQRTHAAHSSPSTMTNSISKLALLPYALIALLAAAPLLASAAFLAGGGAGFSPELPSFHSVVPNAPTTPALDKSKSATASFNWAGYAAQGQFSGVSGAWHVPQISAEGQDIAADATWVGIGGVGTTDLIQAGTQATIENGAVAYRAWYELLPGYMMFVPLNVSAGDKVSASITEAGAGRWNIDITDQTNDKLYATNVAYDSSQSSVEWIEERPSTDAGTLLPLDDFGSVDWQSATAVGLNGEPIAAADAGVRPITMYGLDGTELAAPSALNADGSFSIQRESLQPPVQSAIQPSSPAQPPYIIILQIIPPTGPAPAAPAISPSSSSVSESVTQSSANGTHGEYSVYVDGKLVEHKSW